MQEQIDKLLMKIDYLEKMVSGYQQYLILTWTILGVVVAIVGIALFFLVKMWFNNRFEEESKKIDTKIKEFAAKNPQVLWIKSFGTLISIKEDDDGKSSEIQFNVSTKITKDSIIFSEFHFIIGKQKILIDDYDIIEAKDNTVKVMLRHPHDSGFNQIETFIMWQNPIYFNS